MQLAGQGVLTIGDSLSMPRPWDADSPSGPAECWPNLLSKRLKVGWHWHVGVGGAMVRDIRRYLGRIINYLDPVNCGLIVVQVGVVDATPRAYPHLIERLLSKAGKLSILTRVVKRIRRARLFYRLWGRPWVSTRAFAKQVSATVLMAKSKNIPIFFTEVAEPGPRLLGLTRRSNADRYNQVLRSCVSTLGHGAVVSFRPQLIADGYHLSVEDHILLVDAIFDAWEKK